MISLSLFSFLRSLEVYVDSRNSGDWESCVVVRDLDKKGLPAGWVQRAFVGLSASTGQLADNHDIIYLKTSSDAALLELNEVVDTQTPKFSLDGTHFPEEKDQRMAEAISKLMESLETLDHHVEHQLAAVMDHIKNLVAKLEKREDTSESRITNLEGLIKEQVEGSLESRLHALELQMKGSVERKMSNIESALDRKMGRIESKTSEMAMTSSSAWRMPFFLLLLVMAAAAGGLFYFYRRLQKMHIL